MDASAFFLIFGQVMTLVFNPWTS